MGNARVMLKVRNENMLRRQGEGEREKKYESASMIESNNKGELE